MTISFYKGLTRNLKIGNTPVWLGDWDKSGIPNLAWMSLMKFYWILQNPIVTAFTFSELLREIQKTGGKISPSPSPPAILIRVNILAGLNVLCDLFSFLKWRTLENWRFDKVICRRPSIFLMFNETFN